MIDFGNVTNRSEMANLNVESFISNLCPMCSSYVWGKLLCSTLDQPRNGRLFAFWGGEGEATHFHDGSTPVVQS